MLAISFTPLYSTASVSCIEALQVPSEPHVSDSIQLYEKERSSAPTGLTSGLYFRKLKEIERFSKEFGQIKESEHPELRDSRFQSAIKTIILHPRENLNSADLAVLESRPLFRRVTRGVLSMLIVGEIQFRLAQKISQYWEGPARARFYREKTFRNKALALIRGVYNGPLRFMVALPVLPRVDSPANKILVQQFKDPNRPLSDHEVEILKNAGALNLYLDKSQFMASRPAWTKIRRWVRNALLGAIALNGALIGNLALHLSAKDAFVSVDAFLSEPSYRLQENQVRIYNESVPFPHMAIEIDGKVYSYGQTNETSRSAREYLLAERIEQAEQLKAEASQNEKTAPHGTLERAIHFTGLDRLPRSVQMVTLNLSVAGKSALKRRLELATGMNYRNHTLAMDCSSMVAIGLRASSDVVIPELIDASPGSVLMYLAALKSTGTTNRNGQPLVASFSDVAMSATDKPTMHLLRNLYINALDSRAFWSMFAFSAPQRVILDVRYGSENFQYLRPEVEREFTSWQAEESTSLKSDESDLGLQLGIFEERAQKLGSVPPAGRSAQWQQEEAEFVEIANQHIEVRIGQELSRMQSTDSDFQDLLRSAYRYDLLTQWESYLQSKSTGDATSIVTPTPASLILQRLRNGEGPYAPNKTH